MPPYHQGHPFPVSSSPIRPLDAHPIRSKRPSPLSVSDTPRRVTTTSGVATIGQNAHEYVSDTARSVPTNWTDNATAVHLDTSTLGSQYGQVTAGSAGITSSPPYLPSCSPASIPAGWDEPMVLSPYTPFPHGPQGGTTFFYRSPTPTARQRTNQACEKCRDRKTKCSGGRPACDRCQARGLICEYATEHRVRGPARARKRNLSPFDVPTSISPTRASYAHHPYAPPAPLGDSRWDLQPISPKGRETSTAPRASWSLSDHSDESSDSSGAASFELSERTRYLGWCNAQIVDSTSHQSRRGLQPIEQPSRFQATHRSTVDTKNQFLEPMLRPSPSMPQLMPQALQNSILHGSHGTCSGTSYPGSVALDKSFTEFLSSSQESLRYPSSSSSRASHSHSSAEDEQDPLARVMSSNPTMLVNWPAAVGGAKERRDVWKAEGSLPVVTSATDTEGDTPRSSSQTFNVSEWITGTDDCSSPVHTSPLQTTQDN